MSARAEIRIWSATGSDLAWHYAIRHRVFVEEQGALVLTAWAGLFWILALVIDQVKRRVLADRGRRTETR